MKERKAAEVVKKRELRQLKAREQRGCVFFARCPSNSSTFHFLQQDSERRDPRLIPSSALRVHGRVETSLLSLLEGEDDRCKVVIPRSNCEDEDALARSQGERFLGVVVVASIVVSIVALRPSSRVFRAPSGLGVSPFFSSLARGGNILVFVRCSRSFKRKEAQFETHGAIT